MKVFLDVTRLATRIVRSSPSGIDRVEYAYAKHLLETHDTICVYTAPVLSGAIRRTRALDILERVKLAWRLDATAEDDTNYRDLRAWLDSPIDLKAARPVRVKSSTYWSAIAKGAGFFPLLDLARGQARLDRWISRHSDEPTMFFHCSHAQLHKPNLFEWLGSKNLRSAFFVHDAIPIDFPEFCSPGSYDRHQRRLATVSNHATLVVVNSQYTQRTIEAALREQGARVPEIEILPLAVDETFAKPKRRAPPRSGVPYFLYVGTIEPRKNLSFLLAVWRRLVERLGPRAPRLVIAGRRGWENENIIDVLERSRVLAPFVAEAADLTDAGLARLMADSAALLAPSFTEGFGLPIAECLATGTPVVASDVAAHREVGADHALFADAIDGPAWVALIEALMDEGSEIRQQRLEKISSYRPLSWRTHVMAARDLMERSALSPGSQRAWAPSGTLINSNSRLP